MEDMNIRLTTPRKFGIVFIVLLVVLFILIYSQSDRFKKNNLRTAPTHTPISITTPK